MVDVARVAQSPSVVHAVAEWSRDPVHSKLAGRLRHELHTELAFGPYTDVLLLDEAGCILLSVSDHSDTTGADTQAAIAAACASGEPALSDFYRCPHGMVHLDAVAPVADPAGRRLAVAVLRSRADGFMHSLIESWPTRSRSAETLLVRREGDEAVFLNDLRHRQQTALTLRFPLTRTDVPAVQAILGREGPWEGRDYRGVDVLADVRPIPGSPWFMIAKIDAREVLGEIRYRAQATGGVGALLILLAAAAAAWISRRRETVALRCAVGELQESEERIRAIADAAHDAIVVMDPGGGTTFWNPAAEKIFGYTRAEAIGRNTHEMLAPARYLPAYREAIPGFLRTGEGPVIGSTVQLQARRKDEREIRVALSLSRLRIGSAWHAVGIVRDETERLETEDRLRQKNRELEAATARANALAVEARKADVAKSDFLANMSHEIRTPLNAVIALASLLTESDLRPDQRNHVEVMQSSGTALLKIVDDILDYSRIEAGKLHLETVDFDPHSVLDHVIAQATETAAQKGLELACSTGRDVPHRLCGDPHRLRQVLTNLVGNAIKFTGQGRMNVGAVLKQESANEALVRFSVHDEGIGIPEEMQQAIFQSFTQADASTTRKYGGTGLGLAIASRLVTLMGGQIGVISKQGQGSEFWFTVPVAKQSPPDAAGA
ncbi:MAG: ATP-binding protein [Candidatus Eisenbacteria bacterium]